MASLDFTTTLSPTDIVANLALAVGTAYSGQNISTFATLCFREAVGEPGATAWAFRVKAGGAFQLKPEAGTPIWVWTDEPPCSVILSAQL